jgi:hypothetical protein
MAPWSFGPMSLILEEGAMSYKRWWCWVCAVALVGCSGDGDGSGGSGGSGGSAGTSSASGGGSPDGSTESGASGGGAVDPGCATADRNGFFADCSLCGSDCDTIDVGTGTRRACGCTGGCPCGLRCGSYQIAPNVFVSDICVR